jgi:hypothetical protein
VGFRNGGYERPGYAARLSHLGSKAQQPAPCSPRFPVDRKPHLIGRTLSAFGLLFRSTVTRQPPPTCASNVLRSQCWAEPTDFSACALLWTRPLGPARLLTHVQTTVEREICPGSEARFVAGEPRDNRGNLGGCPETAYRNALDDCIQYFGTHGTNHVCSDVPR